MIAEALFEIFGCRKVLIVTTDRVESFDGSRWTSSWATSLDLTPAATSAPSMTLEVTPNGERRIVLDREKPLDEEELVQFEMLESWATRAMLHASLASRARKVSSDPRIQVTRSFGVEMLRRLAAGESLDGIAAMIADLLESSIWIHFREEEGFVLRGVACFSEPERALRDYLRSQPSMPRDGLPGLTLQLRKSVAYLDLRAGHLSQFARTREEAALLRDLPSCSVVSVPVWKAEDVCAVIIAIRVRPGTLDDSDVILLEGIADRLGVALAADERGRERENALAAAEQAFRREQDARLRYESIFAAITDGIVIAADDGTVRDLNERALELLGLDSTHETLGLQLGQILRLENSAGEKIDPCDTLTGPLSRGENPGTFWGRALLPSDSYRDVSIVAGPMRGQGDRPGVVIVIRDIGEILDLHRRKDEFLSIVSHELRTPLTSIKGYTQLLRSVPDLSEDERDKYLDSALSEINRMVTMIAELLDLSKIERSGVQVRKAPIEWKPFLEQRAATFRLLNDREIEVTAQEGVIIAVDATRIQQAIDNLLSNAVRYSDPDSPISIEVTEDDSWITTSIIDRGIGIPREEMKRLFERFQRGALGTQRNYGGLGLGLYISKAIVVAHDGRIDIESEEGKGSRFTIRLPRLIH